MQACRLTQDSLLSNLDIFQFPGLIEVLSRKGLLALNYLTSKLHVRSYHFNVVFF